MESPPFRFKRFHLEQNGVAHPAGTDGVLLGAWASVDRKPARILDIGTGTGLIALFLAQRTEGCQVEEIVGVEVHQASAACAARNFQASPWAAKLAIVHSAVQDFCLANSKQFDLIVCNPPFFTNGISAPDPTRRLARTASKLTAFALLEAIGRLLKPEGLFCTILPVMEGWRLTELAACRGLYCTRMTSVYGRAGKPVERLLLQFETSPYAFERSELTIYQNQGVYSEALKRLTGAFYLNV